MQILVDMNLPPRWVEVLQREGHEATHWTSVGPGDASDRRLMQWAKNHADLVFTHDLDFSALLATTQATAPSILQIRTDDVLPGVHADTVLRALQQFETELKDGAILSVDPENARVRHLPLGE